MDKFLIIDGNSLIFRAYYALPFLTNTKGEPTGAVFGFLNMLLKVLEEYKPTHLAVAFDFARKTFRNKIFAEYKGTRSETPPELRAQFPVMKDILKKMGIKTIEQKCIEADDIIGTLAKATNCQTVILSGDRDVLQLIDDTTDVWLTKKGISEIYKVNSEVLLQDFHLLPKQVIDLKGLMGDSSDNIPGVKGIGPKTATTLIEQFDSLENIYENLDNPNITKGVREKLENGLESAKMSKILATIKTDCDIPLNFEDYKLNLPFNKETSEIIMDNNMNSLLKRSDFFTKIEEIIEQPKNYEIIEILSPKEIEKVINNKKVEKFAFYTQDNILIFAVDDEKIYKTKDEYNLFYQAPDIAECLQILKPIFENEKIEIVCDDVKKNMHILDKYNIKLQKNVFDLNIASYILNSKYDYELVANYFNLKNTYLKHLERQKMLSLYENIDRPLVDVLYEMENNGFLIDGKQLEELSKDVESKLDEVSKVIYAYAGKEFNINSPKQLGEILFQDLSLPLGDNKKLSTSFEILIGIIDSHPIIEKILEYRRLNTLKNTYIDSYKKLLENGKIVHTIFNQTLTTTGRLSSSEPNLQNIPVRDGEGKALRKIFVSRFDDGEIVSSDYNQIELRLLAHCSNDEKLISAFNNGKDIHTATASEIFGVPVQDVTQKQRKDAKAVNFGIIYGISEYGLSQNIGISKNNAKMFIEKYFESYPQVKEYMDNNVALAKRLGYAETLFKRRRKIPEINSQRYQERQFGARAAMNMPLQGSASDIIKLAMIKVSQEIKKHNLKCKLILQIHDELVIDCPCNELNMVKTLLKSDMENVILLKIPLPVEIKSGKTYFDV